RVRRGHRADHQPHRGLRRVGRPADARSAQGLRRLYPAPLVARGGGSRVQPGRGPRPHQADWVGARGHLPGQGHVLERPRDRETEPRRPAAGDQDHPRLPDGRVGRHVRVHGLPVAREPGVEVPGGDVDAGQVPGRRGRRRQRRGRRCDLQDGRRRRLPHDRLRELERVRLRPARERRRQLPGGVHQGDRGGGRHRELGAPGRRLDRGPAAHRSRRLARRDLHLRDHPHGQRQGRGAAEVRHLRDHRRAVLRRGPRLRDAAQAGGRRRPGGARQARWLAHPAAAGLGRRRGALDRLGDHGLHALALAAALASVAIAAGLAFKVFSEANEAISTFGLGFLTTGDWDPVHNRFGAAQFIYGTAVSSLGALLIATPLSVAIALFLTELAPRGARTAVGTLVELLAGIPSVILGLWGILVLGPALQGTIEPALHAALGWLPVAGGLFGSDYSLVGLFPAIVVLTIMTVPIVSSLTREIFATVPAAAKEGALALGATRWEMIRTVVLPHSRAGIVAAVILGLGRAVGEAIAVTQVIGGTAGINASIF